MLYDANSNALYRGWYYQSVRMMLDRGGGVTGPPKKCYILFECSLIYHLSTIILKIQVF